MKFRVKDVWHRLPTYPDEVSGVDIHGAELDHDVRPPSQFAIRLQACGRGASVGS